ncbi:hypothetical protein J2X31_001788 [Flavobacterium arsenatis]|uniref:Uncharacterized protein n=1 Tax=Flavobacterium arsenatis TaxID=1484332 RepID=A0ABU1TPA6_9FLAO|nr:hypothetical protein [Flavobacterium arsenatis]MDR6967776.1 hypothetical protein [Flavobacterium arsenatis]
MFPNLLLNFFIKSPEVAVTHLVAQLNDKLSPAEKAIVYTRSLSAFLEEKSYGEVTGGGTAKEEPGEIVFCDLQIELESENIDYTVIHSIIEHLENCGAPKGSKLLVDATQEEIPFGKMEGMAVYLDAENLQEHNCTSEDLDFIQKEIYRLTGARENADRYWEDETTTALYFYGTSYEEMKASAEAFISGYPLCQQARIVRIA